MEMVIYPTARVIERTAALWGGTPVPPPLYKPLKPFSETKRFSTIEFPNAHKAISFAGTLGTEGEGTWEIQFTSTLSSFSDPVVLAIAITPHSVDICTECGNCKRNSCEAHILCYCGE